MRSPNTVFVVGAGASREVGFPVGAGLAELIAAKLGYRVIGGSLSSEHGSQLILDVIQQEAKSRLALNSYLDAAKRLEGGIAFSKSIDSFLNVHRSDKRLQRCGKLGIAATILECENQSGLFIEDGEFRDRHAVNNSWLVHFARSLFDGVTKEEIGRVFEKVSFVVFNYDRCLEHFLYEAVRRHYDLDPEKAGNVLGRLRVFHPYGTIGSLPWQGDEHLPFGMKPNRANMLMMEERIKTYTERVQEEDLLDAIRGEIYNADTLVFLGSSFHPENIAILNPGGESAPKRIFGTTLHISDSDVEDIEATLRGIFPIEYTDAVNEAIYIRNDLRCAQLLQQYSRSLFIEGNRTFGG